MNSALPRIAVTPGEPAGIGPELCLRLAREPGFDAHLIVIADPDLLQHHARLAGIHLRIREVSTTGNAGFERGTLNVLPVSLVSPVVCGRPDPRNAAYVLETLDRAVDGCLTGAFDAMVTGPVNKAVINEAGVSFSGHTEYLARRSGGFPVMMLAASGLRVALATTHLPLSEVSRAITRDGLRQVMRTLERDLRLRFGLGRPRILVCGLNPHAGEGGYLGREEVEIIAPVIQALRKEGLDLEGPLPADTVFIPSSLERADAVLAMYHDQGLPVLKHRAFGHAVNVTLGLPIIRTSVDHGTALELAGQGSADCASMEAAIEMAIELSHHQTAGDKPLRQAH